MTLGRVLSAVVGSRAYQLETRRTVYARHKVYMGIYTTVDSERADEHSVAVSLSDVRGLVTDRMLQHEPLDASK